jgi:SAM-dependent methyltransferase
VNIYTEYYTNQAREYAEHRPTYPEELYNFLAEHAPRNSRVLDCCTGSGQAALELAKRFPSVTAIDINEEQINNAARHDNIEYRVASAEQSGMDANSIDLLTVATGIHWLDLEEFYSEADRILTPQGIIAIWGYGATSITPEIDAVLDQFTGVTLKDYWDDVLWFAWNNYKGLAFPFTTIGDPGFRITKELTLDALRNYLFTWTTYQRYITERGIDPYEEIRSDLEAAWGDPNQKRTVTWTITMKLGRANLQPHGVTVR